MAKRFGNFYNCSVAKPSCWCVLAFIVFTACDSADVRTYRVPKEPIDVSPDHSHDHPPLDVAALPEGHPPLDAAALPEGHPPINALPEGHPEIGSGDMSMAAAAAQGLTPPPPPSNSVSWTTPKGWQEKPGSGFRYATFVVPGSGGATADLSVTVLEGDAGGTLSNINRWRGQLGLGPLTSSQWAKEEKVIRPAGRSMVYATFAGEPSASDGNKKNRMTAAIFSAQGKTWFFKLVGDDATVRSAGSDFMKFLESLKGL